MLSVSSGCQHSASVATLRSQDGLATSGNPLPYSSSTSLMYSTPLYKFRYDYLVQLESQLISTSSTPTPQHPSYLPRARAVLTHPCRPDPTGLWWCVSSVASEHQSHASRAERVVAEQGGSARLLTPTAQVEHFTPDPPHLRHAANQFSKHEAAFAYESSPLVAGQARNYELRRAARARRNERAEWRRSADQALGGRGGEGEEGRSNRKLLKLVALSSLHASSHPQSDHPSRIYHSSTHTSESHLTCWRRQHRVGEPAHPGAAAVPTVVAAGHGRGTVQHSAAFVEV